MLMKQFNPYLLLLFIAGLLIVSCKNNTGKSRNTPFDSGYGNQTAPYMIRTAAQLAWLAEAVNTNKRDVSDGRKYAGKYYKLEADINLQDYGANFNDGKGWIPIGCDYYKRFSGHFDGANKKVTGLYINDSDSDYRGLFGCLWGGTVNNLTIETDDLGVHAKDLTGGLAGYIDNDGTVQNCSVSGTIHGNEYVGGMVGCLRVGTLTNCYVYGQVSGTGMNIGGLAGKVEGGRVLNCSAASTVSGTSDFVGGLVGSVSDAFVAGGKNLGSKVENCFTTGDVTGAADEVGGLIGIIWDGIVVNCYASGKVIGARNVGGVAGHIAPSGQLANCVALNMSVSGSKNVGSIIGHDRNGFHQGNVAFDGMKVTLSGGVAGRISRVRITLAQLKQQTTYTGMGWLFAPEGPWVWGIDDYPLPTLYGQTKASVLPAHLQ